MIEKNNHKRVHLVILLEKYTLYGQQNKYSFNFYKMMIDWILKNIPLEVYYHHSI